MTSRSVRSHRHCSGSSAVVALSSAAVLGLVACQSDRDSAASGSVAEYDGSEEVVSNAAAAVADPPRYAAVEDLRIGALDGPAEIQFGRIRAVDEGPDGTIWVLDSGSPFVRVFDRDGVLLRSFGNEGEGPGELRLVSQLSVTNDSVVLVDSYRIQVFDLAGDFLDGRETFDRMPISVAALEDSPAGRLIAVRQRLNYTRGEPGPHQDTTLVQRLDSGLEFSDRLLALPGRETYLLGELGFYVSPFMSATPTIVLGPDGKIYYSRGDDYEIQVFTLGYRAEVTEDLLSGPTVRRITGEIERIPVTDEAYEQDYRERLAEYEERRPLEGEAAMVYDMLQNDYPTIPHAEYLPVIGRMLVDADGRVLVERVDLDPVEWDLLGPDGRIAGRVALPESFTPRRLTPSHLYGVVRDDFDVQYAVRLSLSPGAAPGAGAVPPSRPAVD